MKYPIMIMTLGVLMGGASYAADMSDAPAGGPHGGRGGPMMMQNLTAEQQACIAQYGCEMPTKPDGARPDKNADGAPSGMRPDKGARPDKGERPDMSDERRANMECITQAMEKCGIDMPTPPSRPAE